MHFGRITILMLICLPVCARAQTAAPQDDEDIQSWNDLQITVPMSKQFDFQTKVTMRFGKNVTRLNDGRFQIGYVWKPTSKLSISPFYWYINARNSAGRIRTESRLNLAITNRIPFKDFAFVHRSTFERRLRRPENTWRYRASLNFEKDLPEKWLPKAKFIIGDEVFYDSATNHFSRNRFSVGIGKTLNKQVSVDILYMRQNDGNSHPGDLNVLWVTWRVKT